MTRATIWTALVWKQGTFYPKRGGTRSLSGVGWYFQRVRPASRHQL